MAQAPIMPVFVDALIGDTLDLSAEEFGAYMLLLFATWRNNGTPLPDDPHKLARICRCSVRRWTHTLRPALIHFFTLGDDGSLHQKRLEKEWRFCAQSRAKNASNGAQGGRPKNQDKPLKTYKMTKPSGSVWVNPNHNPNESPLTLRGEDDLALKLNHSPPLPARETSPPLPSPCDGDDASRAPDPASVPDAVTVFNDPELKAYGVARLGEIIANLTGKPTPTPTPQAEPSPANPVQIAFRKNLARLYVTVGQNLPDDEQWNAWDVISQANAIGDPTQLPPDLAANLAAIQRLDGE